MKSFVLLVSLLLVILRNSINGYKILGIFPMDGKSHNIIGVSLMKGLAEKGHDVTMVSPFPLKTPIKNFRAIVTSNILENSEEQMSMLLELRKQNFFEMFSAICQYGEQITTSTLAEKSFQDLIRSNEKFDVVILDVFANEAILGVANHFNAPVIGVSGFGPSMWVNEMVGSPSPPSFIPNTFLPFTDHMNIFQRFSNLAILTLEKLFFEYCHMPKQEAIYEKSFANPKPKLRDLIRNVSLVLVNSHFSLSYPRPYSNNMIEVGGFYINRKVRPLPENLKQFLDSASDGAIYFSMGSSIRGKTLGKEKVEALLKVFESLEQKVLWKWEDPTLPGKPANVLISDWFPQDDILGHPNVRMFITHGGLLSTTEAIYHGVPILTIPIFGDQPLNAARAEKAGLGRTLAYDDVTEVTLKEAILDILNDKRYEENVKLASIRFRDKPMLPLETAIYWVEYVARHKGAFHLHSGGQDLSFIQYHNLDAFALIAVAIFLLYYAIKKLVYKLCKSKAKRPVTKSKMKIK